MERIFIIVDFFAVSMVALLLEASQRAKPREVLRTRRGMSRVFLPWHLLLGVEQ